MYVPAQADEAVEKLEQGICGGFCWCNRTLREIGEDDAPVDPTTCRPERSCYVE